MNEVYLSRSYLKNPVNSLIILVIMVSFIDLISWTVAYQAKVELVERSGGLVSHIGIILRSMIIPEMATVLIIGVLLDQSHRWFKIDWVDLTWQAILRYELLFLPVLLSSYIVFSPVTQTVRFLVEQYSSYSLSAYWNLYMSTIFSLTAYVQYLFPVLTIGYMLLNGSFVKDVLKQSRPSVVGQK